MVFVNVINNTVQKHHRLATAVQFLAAREWTVAMEIVEVRAVQRIPSLVFGTLADAWSMLRIELATVHVGVALTNTLTMPRHFILAAL